VKFVRRCFALSRGETVTVTAVAAFTALLVGLGIGSGYFDTIDRVKDWLSAVGPLVALVAILVAVWNVRRQLRMTVIAREETLMEDRHPGLQQAVTFASLVNSKLDAGTYEDLPKLLEEYQARGSPDNVRKILDEKWLLLADAATKVLFLEEFNRLNTAADLMKRSSDLNWNYQMSGVSGRDPDREPETILEESNKVLAQGHKYFDEARANLNKIGLSLSNRLKNWNERLPRCRAQIEAYFR
jgi:hypothetical protein